MTYSNDPQPNAYAHIWSPLPNIDFPAPYWINKLKNLALIGCTEPDLAFVELAVAAAAKAAWTITTPSTKQIIEGAAGRSWLCGTKQVMSGVREGEQIANSGGGRFLYGVFAGLDIAAYHAFMVSTGAQGVFDFASYAKKFERNCTGSQSKYRGLTPTGGWPSDTGDTFVGPQYLGTGGNRAGPFLFWNAGEVATFIAWCSFSNLEGSGGVVTEMSIQDYHTGEVFDHCVVDNLFNTSNMGVVQFFATEGRSLQDRVLALMVRFTESVTARAVPVNGGCYIRSFDPAALGTPPFWDMRTMINQRHST